MSFIFLFILHPSCIIFYPCSYLIFFPSFLLIHLSIRDKKAESILVCYRHFYMTHVHILRGINSTSCTFVGGESRRGDAYTKGEKTFFLENLILLCACFPIALWCFEICLVSSMLCCSHRIMRMCWTCIHSYACSDDHLLCYVIIIVISIWLFWCMIKLLIFLTSFLLDRNLLVTLYLSYYYLLYLEGLMCFVQVFQVTGIYVPSSSQLLWFMIEGVIW